MTNSKDIKPPDFYSQIKQILQTARDKAYRQINFIMVEAYWNIGKQIVDEEQNGEDRAKYGSYLIKELSIQLTAEFGKGFSKRNIHNMIKFYTYFPIVQTLSAQLSWSHYILLLKIDNEKARNYYMEESAKSNWSVRALERQINTHYYERILSSKVKQPVVDEAIQNTKELLLTPKDIIKDPYVLEFLNIKQNDSFKLTHQDIGQMNMYVNMFDDLEKSKDDNPTIGIVLCANKDETVVKYSKINDKDNLFVSKYQMYLPSEEELVREVQRDVFEIENMKENK